MSGDDPNYMIGPQVKVSAAGAGYATPPRVTLLYRIAVITTTINVPHFLKLLQAFATQNDSHLVHFFVAGDKKTPEAADDFCNTIDGCHYYSADVQQTLGYKSSDLIGFNNDSRRNIALLEALKWKSDLIVSIDDDMIPQHDPFTPWVQLFSQPFHGLQLGAPNLWFDHGEFTIPKARARGLPADGGYSKTFDLAVNKRIGLAQGTILGIPDCTATVAIADRPFIEAANDILQHGFVVHPRCRAVVNSQMTAFRPEFAPAFAQHYPSQGRNTDLIASLLLRRVARDRDFATYYGPPVALHNRTHRSLLADLQSELYGMTVINEFAEYLERTPLAGKSILDDCQQLIEGCPIVYEQSYNNNGSTRSAMEFWQAWLDDVASVL